MTGDQQLFQPDVEYSFAGRDVAMPGVSNEAIVILVGEGVLSPELAFVCEWFVADLARALCVRCAWNAIRLNSRELPLAVELMDEMQQFASTRPSVGETGIFD